MMGDLHPERGIALSSGLALVIFGGVWLLVAVPVVRGVLTGLRTGDWWSPFVRNARGRYGLLASSRFYAAHRAPEPGRRTARGLTWRWLLWSVVFVGLGWYPMVLALRLGQILLTD